MLRYRAGPAAMRILRERGLTAQTLSALVGPASGPKWIVLAGLDEALLASGLLPAAGDEPRAGVPRPLLVGASAGAWRMLALASRNPEAAHRALLDEYVGMTFPAGRRIRPDEISEAYRTMLSRTFPPDEVGRLAGHPQLDLAAHVVRARACLPGRFVPRVAQVLRLGIAGVLQAVSPRGTDAVFERTLFHTRPREFGPRFDGRVLPMGPDNLLSVALASGTVPIYMRPPRALPGAPRGYYLDGGLSDYHLRQRYLSGERGITLLPHYQRRLVPAWFDRSWKRRAPSRSAIDTVLQIYPSDAFIAGLPGARLPDRDDFFRFATDPSERIRRWSEAAALGRRLGDQWLADLNDGRLLDLIEPFP